MLTIILAEKIGRELERVGAEGNDEYLIKDEDDPHYQYLSQLSTCDLDAFDASDMEGILAELYSLKPTLNQAQKAQVDDLIRLAQRCQRNTNYVLLFTPFGEYASETRDTESEPVFQDVA